LELGHGGQTHGSRPAVGLARPTPNRSYLFSKVHFGDIFHLLFGMKVAASFAFEGSIMGELNQWNDLYGEGGA
jgi:hypothetical protein